MLSVHVHVNLAMAIAIKGQPPRQMQCLKTVENTSKYIQNCIESFPKRMKLTCLGVN